MSILIRFSPKKFAQPLKYVICSSRHISHDQKSLANTNTNPLPQHYDIIIAGGGLVGTALACGIAKNKVLAEKKVLLLEGAPPFKGFSGGQYGNRVSAINNGSVELFKSIGAWDKISSTRYKPVKQMQVWDASSDALITFNHDNFSENVACIIENDLMLDAIYSQLESAQNVKILNKSMVGNVELRMDGNAKNVVGLKNGDSMSCDLLLTDISTPRDKWYLNLHTRLFYLSPVGLSDEVKSLQQSPQTLKASQDNIRAETHSISVEIFEGHLPIFI